MQIGLWLETRVAKKPDLTSAGASPKGPHCDSATATVSARAIVPESKIAVDSKIAAESARLVPARAARFSPEALAMLVSMAIRLHDCRPVATAVGISGCDPIRW